MYVNYAQLFWQHGYFLCDSTMDPQWDSMWIGCNTDRGVKKMNSNLWHASTDSWQSAHRGSCSSSIPPQHIDPLPPISDPTNRATTKNQNIIWKGTISCSNGIELNQHESICTEAWEMISRTEAPGKLNVRQKILNKRRASRYKRMLRLTKCW
jgi:hypothetical protein